MDSLQSRFHALVGQEPGPYVDGSEAKEYGEAEEEQPLAEGDEEAVVLEEEAEGEQVLVEEEGEEAELEQELYEAPLEDEEVALVYEGEEGYEEEEEAVEPELCMEEEAVEDQVEVEDVDDAAIDELLNSASAAAAASDAEAAAEASGHPPPPPPPPTVAPRRQQPDRSRTTQAQQSGRGEPVSRRQPGRGEPPARRPSSSSHVIGGVRVDPEATCIADLRFLSGEDAAHCCQVMHGATFEVAGFGPNKIAVEPNETSKDESKVVVHGLPLGIEWQELKDFFKRCGQVAFAAVRPQPPRRAGGAAGPAPAPVGMVGEVRYDHKEHAREAAKRLDGSMLAGGKIAVDLDGTSKDGTKLIVTGIPAGVEWQELKDHFSPIGMVGYAGIKGEAPMAGGGKGSCMKGCMPFKGMDGKEPGPYGGGGFMMRPGDGFMGGCKGYKGFDKGFDKGCYHFGMAKGKGYGW